MKNLWIIPTDKKPIKGDLLLRHLWKGTPLECISWWRYNETTTLGDTVVYSTLNGSFADTPSSFKTQHIYITSDEEIKEGDWYASFIVDEKTKWETTKLDCVVKADLNKTNEYLVEPFSKYCKKIILTTDQDLLKDGVQAIDDEFLEWFVKNPSCEEVDVVKGFPDGTGYGYNFLDYKIIIPNEEPKQETLEAAENNYPEGDVWNVEQAVIRRLAFMRGAKFQSDRMYSEEDMKKAFEAGKKGYMRGSYLTQEYYFTWNNFKSWFEQFKKK